MVFNCSLNTFRWDKTLVDFDGLGNLIEIEDELFNGESWDLYNSSV